ncbi:MAG: response regulator [Syntrophobacteraceae bacterium]|nr:response regulator [Syntrophobacteraceae bacterium]
MIECDPTAQPETLPQGFELNSRIKILIVDDDDVCRELLRDAIDGEEVEASLASDGIDAMEKLHACPFDILITDLSMPRMDGLTLLRHARQLHPNILAIVITGYGSLESAIEAIRLGAYDYLQKPFKIERITLMTRNAVEKVKILREKDQLLKDIEILYQRLHFLEGECRNLQDTIKTPQNDHGIETPLFLFPRHTLPLNLFEIPHENSTQILSKLERLKELRRDKVIDEAEFSLLKKAIINKFGSKES